MNGPDRTLQDTIESEEPDRVPPPDGPYLTSSQLAAVLALGTMPARPQLNAYLRHVATCAAGCRISADTANECAPGRDLRLEADRESREKRGDSTARTAEVLRDVRGERRAQDMRWGEQNHDPATWSVILSEEVGEVAAEALNVTRRGTEADHRALRIELVQVAAVAVAAIECLDRQQASTLEKGTSDAYPYVWRWRVRLPERKGQRCRITARGALNSIAVEFPDGFMVITSRWAVRRSA